MTPACVVLAAALTAAPAYGTETLACEAGDVFDTLPELRGTKRLRLFVDVLVHELGPENRSIVDLQFVQPNPKEKP